MPTNHLEQLVAEWYEYQGYFVRRNVKVGPRKNGGYECELDIVAFNPTTPHLIHIEPSTDTSKWSTREARYQKKFSAGRKYIRGLFQGIDLPEQLEQQAVFLYGSTRTHQRVGGGQVVMAKDLLRTIVAQLATRRIAKSIVPEQFALLRALHLVCEFRGHEAIRR